MATSGRPSAGMLFVGVVFVGGGVASFTIAVGRASLEDGPSLGLVVGGGAALMALAVAGLWRRRQNRDQGREVVGVRPEPGPLAPLDPFDEASLNQ